MKRFPDFYIVGAPKAGTSTIHRWLERHPQGFMPDPKEPRYFCRFPGPFTGPGADRFERNWIREREPYLDLFAAAGAHQRTGEASTDYLHNPGAAERIRDARPDARIVILLRNPIDRAYSGHVHLIRDQQESESFERALELEEERRAAGWVPLFWHAQRSLYADAVRAYQDAFGRDQVLVLRFEDVIGSGRSAQLSRLCAFLGIEPHELSLPHSNESGVPRSTIVQRILRSDTVRVVGERIVGRRLGRRLREHLVSRNLQDAAPMREETRAALRARFRADVERLSAILGPEFPLWPEFSTRATS